MPFDGQARRYSNKSYFVFKKMIKITRANMTKKRSVIGKYISVILGHTVTRRQVLSRYHITCTVLEL